jgi:hypothetical protein
MLPPAPDTCLALHFSVWPWLMSRAAPTGAFLTEGVVTIGKTSALAITIGDRLFWDATNKVVNKTVCRSAVCRGGLLWRGQPVEYCADEDRPVFAGRDLIRAGRTARLAPRADNSRLLATS